MSRRKCLKFDLKVSDNKGWVECECIVELALSLRYSEGTEKVVLSGFDSYDRGYFGCFDNF